MVSTSVPSLGSVRRRNRRSLLSSNTALRVACLDSGSRNPDTTRLEPPATMPSASATRSGSCQETPAAESATSSRSSRAAEKAKYPPITQASARAKSKISGDVMSRIRSADGTRPPLPSTSSRTPVAFSARKTISMVPTTTATLARTRRNNPRAAIDTIGLTQRTLSLVRQSPWTGSPPETRHAR